MPTCEVWSKTKSERRVRISKSVPEERRKYGCKIYVNRFGGIRNEFPQNILAFILKIHYNSSISKKFSLLKILILKWYPLLFRSKYSNLFLHKSANKKSSRK